MTRRPVWDLMRTRNPLTRLRLRLVPSRVRLVMVPRVLCVPNGQELYLPMANPVWSAPSSLPSMGLRWRSGRKDAAPRR